jgi:hypothetical protein
VSESRGNFFHEGLSIFLVLVFKQALRQPALEKPSASVEKRIAKQTNIMKRLETKQKFINNFNSLLNF